MIIELTFVWKYLSTPAISLIKKCHGVFALPISFSPWLCFISCLRFLYYLMEMICIRTLLCDWIDGSEVKGTCFFCRESRFGFQYSHCSSQPSVTPIPGMAFFSDLYRHQVVHSNTYRQIIHTPYRKINTYLKIFVVINGKRHFSYLL